MGAIESAFDLYIDRLIDRVERVCSGDSDDARRPAARVLVFPRVEDPAAELLQEG